MSTNLSNSGIITSRISDHFPYFICLDILLPKYDPVPKYIKIRPRHTNSLLNFKQEIKAGKICDRLDKDLQSDPNGSYKIIHTTISSALDKHLPLKTVQFKKYKHKKSLLG